MPWPIDQKRSNLEIEAQKDAIDFQASLGGLNLEPPSDLIGFWSGVGRGISIDRRCGVQIRERVARLRAS